MERHGDAMAACVGWIGTQCQGAGISDAAVLARVRASAPGRMAPRARCRRNRRRLVDGVLCTKNASPQELKKDEVQRRADVYVGREEDLTGLAKVVASEHEQTWSSRRKLIRLAIRLADAVQSARQKSPLYKPEARRTDGEKEQKDTRGDMNTALFVSAFSVAFGAVLLRYGGRAALVSVLGLDFIDSTMSGKVRELLDGFDAFGSAKYGIFLAGWVVSKTLMIDAGSLVLALSSGILFGDPLLGGVISAGCATIGSLPAYYLARSVLRGQVDRAIERRPIFRALRTVVTTKGFQTVLTLRLSPVLPIPLGAYNYIYGGSALGAVPLVCGTFLGSLKPYILDAYLGSFVLMPIVNSAKGEAGMAAAQSDSILLATLGVAALVGTFASQLAVDTWKQVEEEAEKLNSASAEAGGNDVASTKSPVWMQLWGINVERLSDNSKRWIAAFETSIEQYWLVVENEKLRLAASRDPAQGREKDGNAETPAEQLPHEYIPPPAITPEGKVDTRLWLCESIVLVPVIFPRVLTSASVKTDA
ncbi:TVP38/TMEM64 family membrane protein [Porphyridium purpureum]|uniref:TVP38/TMEM64 family membrane protein n=1 Tax=Porphyridium purpureum TaxID=35688 RepID=A0A5J4YVV7_PORPP|nr:TVP38/TMEM64 family membrane protein [Porphyridium purpureum]|eukprot:POR1393..scf209_3